ncbi:Uncharacterized conserved protein [Candidatus Ornithobacterium hominis]|uniref:Uncharacterized conserved protein n=1 Tax=Candidatus Ornithobacterium hominis TaxID=2497989 RepID=A0A383U312_9FLAO|nr:AAA family ATPase [Candidatus Ornithobacterium hominis]MCT7904722.1 AAA family ATPase [Candidatus Ornithobacterium hominis]SZD73930.1 Uncharacterized conserved protein [Candidatus Ornithobacterium hominis]
MKIKSIEICNYRLYKGLNKIIFNNNEGENIHLICGENGFGKTTFLTSLLWCLYGRMIIDIDESFRKEILSNSYNTFLLGNLNNNLKTDILTKVSIQEIQEIKKNGYNLHNEYIKEYSQYFISIEFCDFSIPSIPCDTLKIIRSYDFLREKEHIEILIDEMPNELTKEMGQDIFINDFIISKDIAKFFFFDSERIVSISETNTNDEKRRLCSAYNSILGVKKYEDLKGNLENLRLKFRKKSADIQNRNQLDILLKNLNDKQKSINEIEKEINNLETNLSDYHEENEVLQIKLLMEGNTTSIKDLQKQELLLETIRKKDIEYKSKIKEFLDFAPFAISGDLLVNTKHQIKQDFEIIQSQSNIKIQNDLLDKIKEDLQKNILNILDNKTKITLENSINNIISKYQNDGLKNDSLLNISKEFYDDFNSIYTNIIGTYRTEFRHIVDDYRKNKQVIERTQRNIANIKLKENDVNVKNIRNQKNILEKKIEQTETKLRNLLISKGQMDKDLSNINNEVSKLSKIVSIDDSDTKKDFLASELIDNLTHFLITLKLEKKNSLEEKIKTILNNLIHKEDFVSKVEIIVDEDMLDINLFDKENNIINKEKLSKGEQQLYASSLLQAFIEESQMKFPVFIDSPLQKFDKVHANKIITDFYPTISEQVILFPLLEKELSKNEFEMMKPYLNSVHKIKNQTDFSYIERLNNINDLIP